MWNPFRRKEVRQTLEEILISNGLMTDEITKEQAMNIPSFSACVELITTTIASLPINLYKEKGEKTKIINDDVRVAMLNDTTEDALDSWMWKKAMCEDYLLDGGGYSYINRRGNTVKSLNYVQNQHIGVNAATDPIFKKYQIQVNGLPYRDWEFVKLCRKSKDGVTGKGIIAESNKLLSLVYNQIIFEEAMVKTGGNKRGFLMSNGRLSPDAIRELKDAWKKLYATNSDNVIVLNNGLEFKEASNTSVEMQLSEHKIQNSDEICKLFLVPPTLLSGEAKEEEYNNWIKLCIVPILKAFETALNKELLLPSEKGSFYFAFDYTQLTLGDIEKRFKAYEVAVKNGILQIDEVRFKEDLPPLNLDFIKLGLQDVLYNPKTKEIYTPNTNQTNNIDNPNPNGGTTPSNPNQNGGTPPPNPNPTGGGANENIQPNSGLGKPTK